MSFDAVPRAVQATPTIKFRVVSALSCLFFRVGCM